MVAFEVLAKLRQPSLYDQLMKRADDAQIGASKRIVAPDDRCACERRRRTTYDRQCGAEVEMTVVLAYDDFRFRLV